MKRIILILSVLIFTSCDPLKGEREYNQAVWELKKKEVEIQNKQLDLDYLKRLYEFKEDIEYEEKKRVSDSLLNDFFKQQ